MPNPIDVRKYRGYTIEIYPDLDPTNPRDWDNLGTMVCFHPRYELGDPHNYTPEELIALIKSGDYLCLPLYLFDHSGLAMSTDANRFAVWDSAGWDWGQVGYIIVSKEKIRKEYNCKRITRKIREKVLNALRAEVQAYDAFLRGEVYGYTIIDPHGEPIDSCWGFLGDPEESGLLDYAKNAIDVDLANRPMLFEPAREVIA